MQEIMQLKVSLLHSSPLIWRRLLVHKDTTFFELHHVLQISMGWENYHLFEFSLQGYRIGEIDEEEKSSGFGSDQLLDFTAVKLSDIVTGPNDVMTYSYDFGDGWKHRIEVEAFLSADKALHYPVCTAGQMACPPEDCGGIHSFYHCLDILKDKTHPEYNEIAEWFDKTYKPEKFDKEEVNHQLENLGAYIQKSG